MKKQVKKLVLAKETLQLLDLVCVRGGAGISDMTVCADGSGCGFICVNEEASFQRTC